MLSFFYLSQIPCGLDRTKIKSGKLGLQIRLFHIHEASQTQQLVTGHSLPCPYDGDDGVENILFPFHTVPRGAHH